MAKPNLRRPCVYCIKNLISKRVYVGSALRGADDRWKAHRSLLRNGAHTTIIQRSWNKHGEDAFQFSILEYVDDTERLIEREQYWIDRLHAACPRRGFNRSPTAGNCMGTKHSDEVRAKLSALKRGIPKAPEHRKAIGDAQKGKIIPPEQRAMTAESVRRHFEDHPEARERMREVGRKNGAASKGRKYSDEVRSRMSEGRRKAWLDPEKRANMIAGMKAIKPSDEARAKMSSAQKAAWAHRKKGQ